MVKIRKILNNNAIIVTENSGLDCIWIGSGIGFQKRIGDYPEEKKIERRFVLDKAQQSEEVKHLLTSISMDYLKVAIDIVDYAKENLSEELSNSLYISLADHIANSINLNKKGLAAGTELSWEVKKLYPKEYKIAKRAVEMIEEQTSVAFNEFEVGNIALHLINAQMNNSSVKENTTKKIKDILTIVRIHNKIDLDSDSLAYDRFVTHLRFFFKRMDSRNYSHHENPLISEVKNRYPNSFITMELIEDYLEVELDQDEQLYLCLHIQKLIEKN